MTYWPGQAGSRIYASKLADLEAAYPAWAERADLEICESIEGEK